MLRWMTVAAAVALLAACSRFEASPEERVAERAAARWDAMIARDAERAYGFISPGMRSTIPLHVFEGQVNSRAIIRKKADVASVSCEAEVCTVKVDLTYVYMGGMTALVGQETESSLTERWIATEGDWWYVPKK